MKRLFFFFLLLSNQGAFAQSTAEQAIIEVIETMFDGMRESDSTKILSTLHGEVRLQTTFTTRDGIPRIKGASMKDFAASIAKPHPEIYDEKIWSYEIEIEDLLATAWTEYTFYLGEKMSHCGVNAFQLFKTKEGWKIISITDTRRQENCQTAPVDHQAAINELMDNWHLAAATADEDVFFEGTMTEDAIYLGTDASERWLRDELKEWSKQFFEKDKAWVFKAKQRNIYFSNDGKTAWFEEMLDTWMGDCRGSGVLELSSEGWQLKHYDLSMLVPNDKVDAYLKLIGKEKK